RSRTFVANRRPLVTSWSAAAIASPITRVNEGRSHMLHWFLTGLLLVSGLASGASAQDLARNHFKVIGLNSPTPVSIYDEVPFWRKTIPLVIGEAIAAADQ